MRKFLFAAMIGGGLMQAHAQEVPPAWTAGADAIVSSLVATSPGASIVVSTHGHEVYATARGRSSVELGVPLSTTSVFRIGSLTKTVTAATILELQAQGKLDLDTSISRWLPSFPRADAITIRELLSHSSGVSDAWDAPLAEPMDTAAQLKLIAATPPDFAPGTDWRYSNSGYMILGAIIEKITGERWFDAERDLVLKPLGISEIAYRGDADIVPGLASGYTTDEQGSLARPVLYSMTGPGAAGGLSATAGGVATLLHALATGSIPGADRFRQMIRPARIGTVELPYGLGVVPGTIRGVPIVEHTGGIEGFLSHYVYVPSADLSVAVLENSDAPAVSPRSMARRLAALALGKPYRTFVETTWAAERREGAAGKYAIPGGGVHVMEVRGESLWIRRDNGPAKALVTSADDVLTYAGDGIDYVHLLRDTHGAVVAIEFHDDGAEKGRREVRLPR